MRTERSYRNFFSMVICMVMLIACLSVTVVAYAEGFAVGTTVFVNVDTKLNLRDKPQGNIIGGIRRGEAVTILSEIDRNGYYRIRVNKTGEVCYAYGEYLTLQNIENVKVEKYPQDNVITSGWIDYDKPLSEYDDPDLENATLVVISDSKLNMRKGASRKAARVKYLYYGELLQVVSPEVKNGYILVKDMVDGKVGYVDTEYVTFENPDVIEEPDYCDSTNCWCQNM